MRRVLVVLAIVVGVIGMVIRALHQRIFAYDFAINWTAARAMRDGASVYGWAALQRRAVIEIGPPMQGMFADQFTSFIGLPTTALLYLPLTGLRFDTALLINQGLIYVGFGAAISLAGLGYAPHVRRVGWLCGLLAALYVPALPLSVWLGQVDAWIAVSLALCVWAVQRKHWGWAGAGVAVAALLKISPALLLAYLVLRGKWRAAIGGGATVVIALSLAALIGQPSDLVVFVDRVAPLLADGSRNVQNVALPAVLARLAGGTDGSFTQGLAGWQWITPVLQAAALIGVVWRSRGRDPQASDLAVLIVAALLAGPITWDHYWSWSVVVAVVAGCTLADRRTSIDRSPATQPATSDLIG